MLDKPDKLGVVLTVESGVVLCEQQNCRKNCKSSVSLSFFWSVSSRQIEEGWDFVARPLSNVYNISHEGLE